MFILSAYEIVAIFSKNFIFRKNRPNFILSEK